MTQLVSGDVLDKERILKIARDTVGTEILACCLYGPRMYAHTNEKADLHIFLIIPNYQHKIRNFAKQINESHLSILAIDKEAFESDVEQGELGEFVAEIIALPYKPLVNPHYLEKMEVKIKKRFVLELLENIILQYPELSLELFIKPEYFMYETMRKKAKLFPPLMYSLSSILKKEVRSQNVDFMMRGYLKALKELEVENCLLYADGYIRINKDFIEDKRRQKTAISNILMSVQKAVLPYIRGISSRITNTFLQDQKFFAKSAHQQTETELLRQLDETEKYLLMPTPLGPVPLSDKTNIQEFVRKTVPGGEALKISVEEMGGVLNSVFLLRLEKEQKTQKIIVKKFEDWLGFKWFPLALWTLGTKSFAVLGATRLEREYSINQFMRKRGFTVPRILYVSLKERLIFEDFVEGEKLNEIIKRIITSPKEGSKRDSEIIKVVGREVARAHSLGIGLGDCKPENILVAKNGEICFLDLEQATANGNQPWDIAEFLYYSGHYILPIHSDEAARIIAHSFVEGYLEGGGKKEIVRKASSPKYTKVFSIFTLPHIILIMSNVCKKVGEGKKQ